MKSKIIIIVLAFFFMSATTFSPPVEYVTIGGHTYGLDRSPSCMKNPSCLQGAARVGGEAVVAATAQADQASKDVKATEKKVGEHVEAVAQYQRDAARVTTQWTNFVVDKIGPHNVDAANQRQANQDAVAAIEQFNALPPEMQSQGEANRLNKALQESLDWADRVDTRRNGLIEEGTPIWDDKIALAQKQKDLVFENARLKYELQRVQFKEGEAYRQLKKCAEYAREINELLRKTAGQSGNLIELNDADETIKNLSNKMFGEGNNHTGSVLARPGYSVTPNYYSTESYQVRAQRLIDALPPGQKSAAKAAIAKPGTTKTVPPPAGNKSASPGVIEKFKNWIKQQ